MFRPRIRPENFFLDQAAPIWRGLVFAGMGRIKGTGIYWDSSVNRNHGTLTGYTGAGDTPTDKWTIDSKLRRAVLGFDAVDDYVGLRSILLTTWTQCAWVYRTATNSGWNAIMAGDTIAYNNFGLGNLNYLAHNWYRIGVGAGWGGGESTMTVLLNSWAFSRNKTLEDSGVKYTRNKKTRFTMYEWESELAALQDKTDQEVADFLNTLTEQSLKQEAWVSFRTFAVIPNLGLLGGQRLIDKLKAVLAVQEPTGTTDEDVLARAFRRNIEYMADPKSAGIDVSRAEVRTGLQLAIGFGGITTDEIKAILDYGLDTVRPKYTTVYSGQVAEARGRV